MSNVKPVDNKMSISKDVSLELKGIAIILVVLSHITAGLFNNGGPGGLGYQYSLSYQDMV